jgi:alpha-tubulin suppressor-like RCC1 family protein
MRARALILVTGLALSVTAAIGPVAVAEPTAADVSPTSSVLTPVNPVRVLDTRTGSGTPVGPGGSITLDLSSRLPATATAVVLNITGTTPTATTFLVVHPSGVARPDTTNLSLTPGETRAALSTTAVPADRKVVLYNNLGSTHVIADLTGYYATSTGSKYRSVTPARMLDTRTDGGPVGPGGIRSVDLSSKVPAGATAVAFNLTGTNPTAWTYVTAFPHGIPRPSTSNLNLIRAAQTSPNLVVLPVRADRTVDLYNDLGSTDLIVDLVGYYGADADSRFVPVTPERRLDTRTGQGIPFPGGAGPVGPGASVNWSVPSPFDNRNVVVFNLTGTGATTHTFVGVGDGYSPSPTSALNLVPGQTATNLVMAATGGGLNLYNNLGSTHLIGDVAGYFTRTCAGFGGCVHSWGVNWHGERGGNTSGVGPVWDTPDITAIAAGVSHNLALRQDGTALEWGALTDSSPARSVPVPVLSGVTAIAAGYQNSLAVKSDGTVWSWGDGRYGQLGDGLDHGDILVTTPVRVSGLTNAVAVSSGWFNAYAVRADGTVWAWGENSRGQLGNGVACPTPDTQGACASNVPVQVTGLTGVRAVSEDGFALKADGTVWTWGPNFTGKLGVGDPENNTVATVPVQVTGLADVVQIDGSNANRFALKADGTVWSWGSNREGQLGNGTTGDWAGAPVQVSLLTGVTNIAAGEAYNGYAVRSDGTVWAWGYNLNGNLGVPNAGSQSSVPLKIPNLGGVTKVSGYYFGALALVPQPN